MRSVSCRAYPGSASTAVEASCIAVSVSSEMVLITPMDWLISSVVTDCSSGALAMAHLTRRVIHHCDNGL